MIKRFIIVFTISLSLAASIFWAGLCFAAPFITCDDPPSAENITSYVVTMDGGAAIEVDAPLHYDLAGVPDGTYSVEVQAVNIWGMGPAANFDFTKALPSGPAVVGLSID